jgi:HEAT repeat protein
MSATDSFRSVEASARRVPCGTVVQVLAALAFVLFFAPGRAPVRAAPLELAPDRGGRHDVLDLEPAVAQAELVLAVRLADVTETKIVHGGRNVEVTQQFRLEPVRVLKGIFAREALLMTGQDLGIYRFAEGSGRLERGQLLLVLLGRQGQNYFNCNFNGVPTLAQSIPRLEGQDDPLLASVEVLIKMTRERDRSARVALLVEGLKAAKARGVAPLLLAMGRRALPAAQVPGVLAVVAPHLKAGPAAVREIAARTLGSLLDAAPRDQGLPRAEVAAALAAALEAAGPDAGARVALIDALGSAGEPARRDRAALAWLRADRPALTLAETAARLRALGKLGAAERKDEVSRAFAALPLDAPAEVQDAAGAALGRLDPKSAAGLISSRLAAKDAAGLGVALEVALLGQLPTGFAAPELLKAWGRPLDARERLAFAAACATAADARLVPALASLLDPRQPQVRERAVAALVRIDADEAASALWPHLDEENDPASRLRLVAFLGRHGFRDGYAQAIEHLSQSALREEAVAALAALGDPRAVPELRRIWRTSNDLAWNAAAIRALARLGQADIAPRLLEIARAPGDPLAPSALIGLGDLGSGEALPVARKALGSRNDELVIAAARSAARLLSRRGLSDDGVRDRLAALLTDVDASPPVRQAALESLTALDDPRLPPALAAVARDANLEGTPLLAEVERALSQRRSPAEPRAE